MTNTNMDSIVDYLSDDESDSEVPAGCVSLSSIYFCFCKLYFNIS